MISISVEIKTKNYAIITSIQLMLEILDNEARQDKASRDVRIKKKKIKQITEKIIQGNL